MIETLSGTLNRHRRAWTLIFVVVGTVFPFLFLNRYSISGADECYQALCCRDYGNSPLAMFSFYIGHLWCSLFGESILNLRILMVVCYLLSIGVGCLYLYLKSRKTILASVIYMMLAVGSWHSGMNIYNWDTGTYLWLALLLIGMLRYADKPSLVNLIVVGIFSGVVVMSRITLLVVLPVILIEIIVVNHKRIMKIFCDSLIGLMAFLLTVLILVIVMKGSIEAYVSSWNTDNIISGHTTFATYLWRFKMILNPVITAYFPLVSAALATFVLLMSKRNGVMIICVSVGAIFAITTAVSRLIFISTIEFIAGFFHPLFWALLLLIPLYNSVHPDRRVKIPVLKLCLVFAIACIPIIGSDSTIERLMVIQTIPLLCTITSPVIGKSIKVYISFCCVAVFSLWFNHVYILPDMTPCEMKDYRGLSGLYDSQQERKLFDNLSPVVKQLQSAGKTFTFVGINKYDADYSFTDGVGSHHQRFHYGEWEEGNKDSEINQIISGYEYIFMVDKYQRDPTINYSLDYVRSYFSDSGCEIITDNESFTLYKTSRCK